MPPDGSARRTGVTRAWFGPSACAVLLALAASCDQSPSAPAPKAAESTASNQGVGAPDTASTPDGPATPFGHDPAWPAWAQWPRVVGGVTLYHPMIEEWRGAVIFTRSAVQCAAGTTGLVTLQWTVAFDGRRVTLRTPTIAACAWDGAPEPATACRAALDAGLADCTWVFPIEGVLSLMAPDTLPPEPTVEQAELLRAARQEAEHAGLSLLNDREAVYLHERWPRDETDALVIAAADPTPIPAPCGAWTMGPLRTLGRDGRVHELRAARWIQLTRDGWTAPSLEAAQARFSDFPASGSLSEAREQFERTIAQRDKVYGLLDRTAYRWSEAVERMHEQRDPPPPPAP